MKVPCLNCKDRNMYCHDSCKKYIKYSYEKEKSRINKKEMDYGNYLYDAINRMQTIKSTN